MSIPKLRTGSCFPILLGRRRRIDQALCAVIVDTCLHGVSVRRVDNLAEALDADTKMSN